MKLENKKIVFLGDSITAGVGVTDRNNRYDNRLKRMCGLAATVNCGISGTRFAYQRKPSAVKSFDLYFCGRAVLLDEDADIVVVYGGVNDYYHGDAPFGDESDRTPETFIGATHCLMNTLVDHFVSRGKTVVFMTPARMHFGGISDTQVSNNSFKAPDSKPLVAYVDVILKAAPLYGIHTIDLYRELPINPNIPEDAEKYTVDGLHFNDLGHGVIADLLKERLEQI